MDIIKTRSITGKTNARIKSTKPENFKNPSNPPKECFTKLKRISRRVEEILRTKKMV
jgi:hypothetical protein